MVCMVWVGEEREQKRIGIYGQVIISPRGQARIANPIFRPFPTAVGGRDGRGERLEPRPSHKLLG